MLLKGSGEYALNMLFKDMILAKYPIMLDLEYLKQKVDISVFYGKRDWMNVSFGREVASV